MYPLNDKDLDRLSREAAEQFDVEASTSGWEHLEQRLNKELPLKDDKDRRRFLLWLFLIAFIAGGTLTWMLTGNRPNELIANRTNNSSNPVKEATKETNPAAGNPVRENDDRQPEQNTFAEKPVNQPETGKAEAITPTTRQTPAQPGTSGEKTTANTLVQNTQTVKGKKTTTAETGTDVTNNNVQEIKPGKKNKTNQPLPRPVRRLTEKEGLVSNTRGNKSNKSNNSKAESSKDIPNKDLADAGKPVQQQTTQTGDPTNTGQTTIAATEKTTTDESINKTDSTAVTEDAVTVATESKKDSAVAPVKAVTQNKKQGSSPKVKAPVELGIVTGPDFSNVGFKYGYKTGISFGLTAGYRITDRFAVNSGFIYTKKFYKAGGEDFHPPKHTWLSYQDIQMVKGDCSMFEIPLNLRYDVVVQKQNRYFISSGLTSYLMKNQYYDCDYISNTGTGAKYQWETDTSINYVMSVLNISAGFEHNLGKHFSIQAEPYLKIPLKGMGYGNMHLDSYGLYLSLKYKPWIRK